jgi:hypothetical protein
LNEKRKLVGFFLFHFDYIVGIDGFYRSRKEALKTGRHRCGTSSYGITISGRDTWTVAFVWLQFNKVVPIFSSTILEASLYICRLAFFAITPVGKTNHKRPALGPQQEGDTREIQKNNHKKRKT